MASDDQSAVVADATADDLHGGANAEPSDAQISQDIASKDTGTDEESLGSGVLSLDNIASLQEMAARVTLANNEDGTANAHLVIFAMVVCKLMV